MVLSKAAFHSNAKVKANIVLVGSVEEKRAEGSYPEFRCESETAPLLSKRRGLVGQFP